MPSIAALVEPSVLRWARESVDLAPVDAARKIRVPDDRVDEWEAGTRLPTVAELRRAAKVYRRALGVFYLPAPPADFDTLRDFRRRPGGEAAAWSADLHAEYRRAHEQRDNLLELYEIEGVTPPTLWRAPRSAGDDEQLAAAARARILAEAPFPLPRATTDRYAHLNAWSAALEVAGVLVFSTTGGRVDPDEMAAFSLYFDEIPVIVVNGADWPRGRLYSLLHEYAHLVLHSEGLCDTYRATRATNPNGQLEARCNDLAAKMLMPRVEVLARPQVEARRDTPTAWDYNALRDAAAPFGVSAEAFLRRLVTLGRTTQAFYDQRRQEFLTAYREQESEARGSGRSRGNFYNTKPRDLGKGYVRTVDSARARDVIDSATAARMLDVKVHQLDRLARVARLP
jgi:Zn-dependent peptidase ImmA (M78 family)